MDRTNTIARLMAEARADGESGRCELVTLRALVEEATELGADRALTRTGLADPDACDDLDELRELLQVWRDAKASVWRATLAWLVRGMLALVIIGVAVQLGVTDVLR